MSNHGNPPQDPYGQQPQQPGQYGEQPAYGQPTTPYGTQAPYGGSGSYPPAYGDPSGMGGMGGTGGPQGTTEKGFLASLFDFSFSSFITPKVVKFVYALSVVVLVSVWVVFLIGSFVTSPGAGLMVLVLGPIGLLLYLCFIRMTLEFYVAVVRMSEDIHHRLR